MSSSAVTSEILPPAALSVYKRKRMLLDDMGQHGERDEVAVSARLCESRQPLGSQDAADFSQTAARARDLAENGGDQHSVEEPA